MKTSTTKYPDLNLQDNSIDCMLESAKLFSAVLDSLNEGNIIKFLSYNRNLLFNLGLFHYTSIFLSQLIFLLEILNVLLRNLNKQNA